MIGRRLKLAREAAGFSLRDLEAAAGRLVSAQAIGKYERDEMMPSSDVLLALAGTLKVSPEYLLSDPEIELVGVDFRKGPEAGVKEEKAVQAFVLDHVERYLRLEELLGLSSASWREALEDPHPVASVEDAEDVADKLRSSWNLGTDAIPDLAEFLEERGIKVIAKHLASSVFGSKAWVKRKGHDDVPVIVVNSAHTGERQRLTLAHELAHVVMHPVDTMSEVMIEKCANRLAGAFLVPAKTLREKAGTHRSSISLGELFELKRHFRVSVQVLVVRCSQLGIINKAEYGRCWATLKAHGFLTSPWPEPHPVTPEVPRRLERLCFRAIAEDAISEAKAAEILQLSVSELDQRLQAIPETS